MSVDILKEQTEERELREECAKQYRYGDSKKILKAVSAYHCIPVMSRKAREYRARFNASEWMLDIGCGTGYYWRDTRGAKLILMDFAFGNLMAAKTMLKEECGIIFVQADAANLPLKSDSLSGIWSVQVTQHFPDSVMHSFLEESGRVLKERFLLEIYNLNPAILLKVFYKLLGKKFHIKGKSGKTVFNRLNAQELVVLWRSIKREVKFSFGYSELFFHPDMYIKPQARAIEFIENFFNKAPWLSRFFSRQIQIKISSGDFYTR